MSKKRRSQVEVQRDYDNRRRKEGLVRVSLWVPENMKSDLVALAMAMRNGKEEVK